MEADDFLEGRGGISCETRNLMCLQLYVSQSQSRVELRPCRQPTWSSVGTFHTLVSGLPLTLLTSSIEYCIRHQNPICRDETVKCVNLLTFVSETFPAVTAKEMSLGTRWTSRWRTLVWLFHICDCDEAKLLACIYHRISFVGWKTSAQFCVKRNPRSETDRRWTIQTTEISVWMLSRYTYFHHAVAVLPTTYVPACCALYGFISLPGPYMWSNKIMILHDNKY